MKTIKFIIAAALLLSCYTQVSAQEITVRNIWAEEQNSSIAVHYTLVAEKPADVILQYSIDSGRTWFDCKSVTGDLQSQTTGFKTIIWDCRQDGFEKGNLLFNVIVDKHQSPARKNVLGLDLGIGARKVVQEWGTFFDAGIRWTHNFSPYFGWDIVNLKFQGFVKGDFINNGLLQGMTGLRCYTKNFAKDMKGYAAVKAGYGYQPYLKQHSGGGSGFVYELEVGMHITKSLFAGFVYNAQNLHGDNFDAVIPDAGYYFINGGHFKINSSYLGLRVGYNF